MASNTNNTKKAILLEGRYYDVHKLAAVHPGGDLNVYLHAGTDASIAFRSSHRRPFPHDKYKAYLLPNQDPKAYDIARTQPDFKLYDELCEEVKPFLQAHHNGFAPTWYFVKAALLFALAVSIEGYMLLHGRTWLGSIAWGVVGAWIGFNVQHDANHGAVSKNPRVNRILSLTQDYIGGSALGWMIEHNTVHHVHTNDDEKDGDLNIPLFRLHPKYTWTPPNWLQHWYVLALEFSFGAFHVFWNMFEWTRGPQGRLSLLQPWWNTHGLLFALTLVRIIVPFYFEPSLSTVAKIALSYSIGGFYLAFFFLLSHNFQGVNKTVRSNAGDFLTNQVETSSNVAGWWLMMFNGGLNYQIEHHLFPRVHHYYYPGLAPLVRAFCAKHKVQYVHFPTVWSNFASTVRHLRDLSTP